MLSHIVNMSYKSYSNSLEEKIAMNNSDTIITTGEGFKREIDFIWTYNCCFHQGLQDLYTNRNIVPHAIGDHESCCWNPWPVR